MTKYNSDSIETLRFPDNVRKNPSMYIGGTDAHGLFVVLRECADNAVDEYLAGRNKFAAIMSDKDGSFWVQDGGSGIPQGTKVVEVNVNGKIIKSKMPTMQAVFGELHTSGKFRSDAYATSIGCFSGETKVELVDGRTLSMARIYSEHQQGVQNYVWTINRKTGDLRAQPIERAMITGKTRHMVKVSLDTGEDFVCTPDHPLYQTNLRKIEAEEALGASLLSIGFDTSHDGYRVMPVVGNWPVRLQRVVASYYGQEIDNRHVHHLDENKLNNEPNNLESLTPTQHYLEHPEKLEAWLVYLASSGDQKSRLLNRRNNRSWYIKLQQQGKAVKIACRVLSLGLELTEDNYDRNKFHGAPSWSKAIERFEDEKELLLLSASILKRAKEHARKKLSKGIRFLQALNYTPGLSESSTCFDQSEVTIARRIVGKAVRSLESIPEQDCTSSEIDLCFKKGSTITSRGLCQYIDLEEFVSAVRNGVDPCNFLYSDLSKTELQTRKNKFDKDDATRRIAGWGIAPTTRQANFFLRNLNAMISSGELITQSNYHERFKNAAGNSSWYLGVRACAKLGIIGKEAILEASSSMNHKVVSVEHIYYEEAIPVYDLSVGIDHNYRLACGVFVGNSHGVGVKGTNATAEFMDVYTCYNGSWFAIGFKKGKLTTPVRAASAPKSPFTGKPLAKGTLIHFKPDATIFSVKAFPPSMLVEWSEIQAYLNPGLQVVVNIKGKQKSFLSKEGPKEYINQRLTKMEAASEPDMFEHQSDLVHAVVAFSNADGFELRGFTNGLSNSQGGKHVDSVASALYESIAPHRAAKQTFTAADFRDGMVGIVNAKLHKAAFSSQDKAKLTDDRMASKEFQAELKAAATKFFNANKAMAKRLCDRASKISELKTKFKASKAVATELNKVKKQGLPPNYAPAHKSVPVKDRELFIVEGDSAAGGVRQVRAPNQALLPLSGKILNVLKSKGDKALLSKAILNILGALGFDPKQEDPLKKLQVGKVICLSDADPDGSHINCLLNALFSRYLPGMYEQGMIYVADMPEFYSIHKDQIFTGDSLSEVHGKLAKAKVKAEVMHAKGWGEVDAQVLKILAVDSTRRLIRIKPLSGSDTNTFNGLMGRPDASEIETKEISSE